MLNINEHIQIPLKEFDFDFVRSSGPGGQNVNKVNTKAVMTWDVLNTSSISEGVKTRFRKKYHRRINNEGIFTITSQRFRDRGRNVADCLSKLRDFVLEVAVAPTYRKKTRPTKASKVRRLQDKQSNSQKKQMRRPPSVD